MFVTFMTPWFAAAMGQREDPIRQARELVMENRINDAILLLEQTVRDDPERIDEAESLLKTIREIRGEYNILFEQLIDNLVNSPDDIETTLDIIERMEALDEFPNERVVQQVEDARVVAQLAYDRSLLERAMDAARSLLASNEYTAAVQQYVSVNDLQRRVFDDRGYGDIFRNSVDDAVATYLAAADAFAAVLAGNDSAARDLVAVLEQSSRVPADEEIAPFIDSRVAAQAIVESSETAANELSVLRSQVGLQFPDNPVDWYLNFKDVTLRGRSEFRNDEGMLFAQQTAFEANVDSVYGAFAARLDADLAAASEHVRMARYDAAARIHESIDRTASGEEEVRLSVYAAAEDPTIAEIALLDIDVSNANRLIQLRARRSSSASLVNLYEALGAVAAGGEDRANTLFSLRSRQDAVLSIYAVMERDFSAWRDTAEAIESTGALDTAGAVILASTTNEWTRRLSDVASLAADLTVDIAQRRRLDVVEAVNAEIARIDESRPLLDGVEIEVPGEDDTVTIRISRFPDDVINTMIGVNQRVSNAQEEFAGLRDDFLALPASIQGISQYRDELELVSELGRRLEVVQQSVGETRTAAQDLIQQSDALRETGDNRVADARAAIAGLLVTTAKDNWNAAREAYYAALEFREDEEFRAAVDALILELGADIQEAENVIVVRRVRELLIDAQALYNRDEYTGARDVLLEATQLWEQTNVDPNAEIGRLLRLVTAALNLEEGRELTVTDPLYPILGNYLSLAKEDFAVAEGLLADGEASRADRFFDRSLENLRNVRDVRPLNWEARILELRIAQLRSDEGFEAVFESRYNQALERLNEAGPVAVYAELEVLSEINPDFPGLQGQIVELEIQLNLREDPVDQARINQAASLVARAEDLVASGGRDALVVAVSLLEEAVTINPGDGDAQFLLDDLRIQLGGQAQVALSSADDQQYRRAETLFSQGRVLQALSIVERLVSNETNANYPPLVDLRRRISLRLGI